MKPDHEPTSTSRPAVTGFRFRAILLPAAAPLLGLSITLLCGAPVFGQTPTEPVPATKPAFPELSRLNFECVNLFQQMQGSVLRVQMPASRWNNNTDVANEPRFNRFKLNDNVKNDLQQRASRGGGYYDQESGNRAAGVQSPATSPTTSSPAPTPTSQSSGALPGGAGDNSLDNNSGKGQQQGYTIIVPAQQLPEQQQLAVGNVAGNKLPFVANAVGLLLSDRHVLVPVYLEREAVGDQLIKLACGDGEPIYAKFVGSDQQTQLTVLQLNDPAHVGVTVGKKAKDSNGATAGAVDRPSQPKTSDVVADAGACLGKPVTLSDKPLAEGSVVLMLSPADGAARLVVWTSSLRDAGVVVTIDGQVAGIARHGQFLSGGACRLIADQIVRHGAVRRATLGVIISQVDANDPARQHADLGQLPAVRVDQVMKDSVAEKGGLRKGDLILTLAGDPVHNIPTLAAAIAARQGLTELKVMRDGKIISMRVDLVQK